MHIFVDLPHFTGVGLFQLLHCRLAGIDTGNLGSFTGYIDHFAFLQPFLARVGCHQFVDGYLVGCRQRPIGIAILDSMGVELLDVLFEFNLVRGVGLDFYHVAHDEIVGINARVEFKQCFDSSVELFRHAVHGLTWLNGVIDNACIASVGARLRDDEHIALAHTTV